MARSLTPTAVWAAVEPVMHCPFEWGRSDCTTAVCDVFAALHGIDLLAPWRGSYACHMGAARLVARMGGPQRALETMAARAGLQRGALVGGIGLSGKTLVICVRPDLWAGKTETGLALVQTATEAWHCA